MTSMYNFVILIAAIKGFESGVKSFRFISEFKWIPSKVSLVLSIITVIVEILTNVFIAYKWPILFVSCLILTEPFYLRQLSNLYRKVTIKKEI